jgi:hypothetical protein
MCQQHARARVKRRAGRAHVIYQDHDAAAQESRGPPRGERPFHVAVAAGGGQLRLRVCRPDARKGSDDGEAEVSGQIVRLIESSLPAPGAVKRDGDRIVRSLQDVVTPQARQGRERTRQ